MKQLKPSTIARYSAKQLWNAVIIRDDAYSHDGYGSIYRREGDAYFFHASFEWDREAAIEALVDCGGAPMQALHGNYRLGLRW